MRIVPSLIGVRKLSCFSDVMPVSGWNQWAKCVAPFSSAHSFIACATSLAMSRSSGLPSSMTWRSSRYVGLGSRSCITASVNSRLPNS